MSQTIWRTCIALAVPLALPTRTHFASSQKLPNRKTNSTEVFPTLKRTTLQKIILIRLCYHTQNLKKQFGLCKSTQVPLENLSKHNWHVSDYSNFSSLTVGIRTNKIFELQLQDFALLGLKNFQTTKLTPQKSSWRWKEQVCEKSSQTDFAIDHKIRKTSWKALRNSPMVTFHFAKSLPLLCFWISLPLRGVVTH